MLPDHAILIQVQDVELAVAVGEFQLDAGGQLRRPRPHLCNGIFEPIGQIDTGPVGLPAEGVDDGGTRGLHHPRHAQTSGARVHVDFEVDGSVQGLQHLGYHAVVNEEMSRARHRVLTVNNPAQRGALGIIGPFIDDHLLPAVPILDLSRPPEHHRKVQPIQPCITVVPLRDVTSEDTLTISVSRGRIELAGAPVVAVAVPVLDPTNRPLIGHPAIPFCVERNVMMPGGMEAYE